ncbi:acyl carrier protein [[Clostridium] polysaccharolyticum]|uniref:Acyl carrier protein n=1 Tax=[Clostridium] polysaccharolyticum TaxID=29364 RepID=A0A1I0A9X4_9FIRM|nr:phosphopantetheine-binding protein [[Clostridium] polysaccharolyticum]SES90535.1 acyl carrier protein [[Clostridium] polysaccharolyticum]
MNQLNFKEFAKNIADYVGMEESQIREETDLYSDLLIDSLGLFSMGIYLTGIYHLEVPLSSVAIVSKVGELFDVLVKEGVPVNGEN